MKPRIASVAFDGGGVFLSAQTPYDRELLVEYLLDCARRHTDVCLTLGGGRWRVERLPPQEASRCRRCGRPIHAAGCSDGRSRMPECIPCALREAASGCVLSSRRQRAAGSVPHGARPRRFGPH